MATIHSVTIDLPAIYSITIDLQTIYLVTNEVSVLTSLPCYCKVLWYVSVCTHKAQTHWTTTTLFQLLLYPHESWLGQAMCDATDD